MKKSFTIIVVYCLWLLPSYAQKKYYISAFGGTSINFNSQAYSSIGIYAPFITTSKIFPSIGFSFDYVGKRNPKCINRLFLASHIVGQKTITYKENFSLAKNLYVQAILYSIQTGYNKEWQVASLHKTNKAKLYAGFLTSINYGLTIKSTYKNQTLVNTQGDSLYFVQNPSTSKKGLYGMINVGFTSRVVFYTQQGKEKYSAGIHLMAGLGRSNKNKVLYFYENYIDQIIISNRGYLCNVFFSIPIFRR